MSGKASNSVWPDTPAVLSTDTEIIKAIQNGNEQVYESLFRQHYRLLCQYGFSFLKDWDDTEEVVQSMFLTLWEKRESLTIDTSLKSYLYRAVHNRCLNRIKHLAVRAEYQQYALYENNATDTAPSQILMATELEERLKKAIDKLPEQCRIIFTMSRFDELKYQEIADQLGLSIKTVENQIGKALRMLRIELADYLPLLLALGIYAYD